MTLRTHWAAWLTALVLIVACPAFAAGLPTVTIRTEAYPRPPYSEATYYVYEQGGKAICTKLAVCNKYDQCDTDYHAGAFLDPQDQKTGTPFHVTAAVPIPLGKRGKHQCLVKLVPDAL